MEVLKEICEICEFFKHEWQEVNKQKKGAESAPF